jgi:ribosomal protein S27AE
MIGGMATTSAARQLTAILRTGAGPLARALVENGGAMRVSDVAALLERDRTDKALRAAIERVVSEGYYKLDGSTSDRRLVRMERLRVARVCPKCSARELVASHDFILSRRALTWCCPAHGVAIDQPNVPYDDPRAAPLPV